MPKIKGNFMLIIMTFPSAIVSNEIIEVLIYARKQKNPVVLTLNHDKPEGISS